jgi:hypothetical protein
VRGPLPLLFPDIERLLRALSTGSGARRALIPGRRVASRAPLGRTMLAPRHGEGKSIQKIDSAAIALNASFLGTP